MEFPQIQTWISWWTLYWCGSVLTYKASKLGYSPRDGLSGKINDSMQNWITEQFLRSKNKISLNNVTILILGLTFKENCPI